MVTRGRKPKPTAQKRLENNPGKRKLNDNEPVYPPLQINSAPQDLDEEGRRVWFELGREMANMSVLQTVDSNSLWRYCDVLVRWRRMARFLNAQIGTPNNPTGIRYPITEQVYKANERGAQIPQYHPDGTPMLRVKSYKTLPEVAEYHRLAETLRRLESDLGLNPTARSRLKVELGKGGGTSGDDDEDDPFAIE